MTRRERQPAAGELEGLILSDGGGAFYEIPTEVIERYRVAADEVLGFAGGDVAPVSDESRSGWAVVGAIYVPHESRLADHPR